MVDVARVTARIAPCARYGHTELYECPPRIQKEQ